MSALLITTAYRVRWRVQERKNALLIGAGLSAMC